MLPRASPLPFDLHETLLDMVKRTRQLVPFDSGGISVVNPATNALVPHVYVGESGHVVTSMPAGEGLIGYVALHREAVIVDDMATDPRCRFIDPKSRAELAVPITFEDEFIGVLNVESHTPGAYTEAHLAILQTIAHQVALIIHTTRRYHTLAAQHNSLLDGLEERKRESDALRKLATITSETLDFDEMLAKAVHEAAALLDCEGAQVLLPDHSTYRLTIHEPSLFGLAKTWPVLSWALDGPGHPVDVYHTGEPFVSRSATIDAGPGCHNLLACPLNTRNRTLGVLRLINRRSGDFEQAQIELSQAIASQIAVSMVGAQVLAAERRRTMMLKQINHISQSLYATLDPHTLLRQAAQHILDVFAPDAVHIFLLMPDNTSVQYQAGATRSSRLALAEDTVFPVDEGLIGQAIRTGESLFVTDLEDEPYGVPHLNAPTLQSGLVVPLRRADESVGAIGLLSTTTFAFRDLERDALETLATQISIALENAQLYHQAQRRLLEQGIVYQIGQDLTAILNYNELAHVMAEHMNRALNTSGCVVALYEPEQNSVLVEADYRAPHHHDMDGSRITGQRLALDAHTAIATAIRSRQPVTIYANDPEADREAPAWLESPGDHSRLIIPMVAGRRVLGIVDWTDNQAGRRFSNEDIRLAKTLVAQATIAIDNALLFRQLEQRAHELAEANRLRSQFLATISHELRTPMNSIIGFTETLLGGLYGELTERQASRMERIQRNAYALLTLIDDLLDLSRIDAGRMKLRLEKLSINSAVEAAIQTMQDAATAKGLSLEVQLADELPYVSADPERLHQVIINLLSNAIKFTPEGRVTIATQAITQQDRKYVQTTITDTGIGINEADQTIIFDEFRQVDGSSTRAYSGTGLGLAITRRLVEMMGGSIWVESTPGEGSAFSFILPVAAQTLSRST